MHHCLKNQIDMIDIFIYTSVTSVHFPEIKDLLSRMHAHVYTGGPGTVDIFITLSNKCDRMSAQSWELEIWIYHCYARF